MTRLLIATLVACAASVSTVLAQHPMREGRWEMTMTMEMPNMPMAMPAQKMVRCITKKDLESPAGVLPGASPGANEKTACKVSDYKVDGNKMTWKMSCPPPQSMSGDAEVVVDGDTFNGTMKMTTDRGQMTMKYAAKRLGDCAP